MDKPALRKTMAKRRSEAHASVDQSGAQRLLLNVLNGTDGPVSFFWPIRTEIDTRPVMEVVSATRRVCLPATSGRAALTFREWRPDAPMIEDGFGVPVPADGNPVVPAVLVVPLLACDPHGHRLGYGAGHYDRTLAELRPKGAVTAIGFAFEAQRLAEPLPIEATDEPLDMLVTEAGVSRFKE